MSFDNQRSEIIDIAKKLLAHGTAAVVIAFGEGEVDGNTVPRFFRTPEELDNMKWGETCTPNLAKYLTEKKEKVAIVAKPCDARAIIMYLVEKQIDRNNVYIIGIECAGMLGKGGKSAAGCSECKVKTPPIYDILIKNPDILKIVKDLKIEEQKAEGLKSEKDLKVEEEKLGELEYSLERFQKEMNKCILCFACRQACYGCYCKTCFVDRDIPNWLPADINMGAKMVFHLGRAMHLAGRCVECGACERACPSGVKIRYLIKELSTMCKDLYGYSAGMSLEETPAIATFNQGDREVGFMGGVDNESCCNSKK